MTTVPGFNYLIQQSGIVRESRQSTNTPNPEPTQTVTEQLANEHAKKTIVQELEEPEKIKQKDIKERERKEREKKKKKMKQQELTEENNLDSTGGLLDTIV